MVFLQSRNPITNPRENQWHSPFLWNYTQWHTWCRPNSCFKLISSWLIDKISENLVTIRNFGNPAVFACSICLSASFKTITLNTQWLWLKWQTFHAHTCVVRCGAWSATCQSTRIWYSNDVQFELRHIRYFTSFPYSTVRWYCTFAFNVINEFIQAWF